MSTIEESIEVAVPVHVAYDQWTQFEEFPQFMEGVEEIRQLDDQRLHWVASIGGQRREWEARITEQDPDHRVAWKSEDGQSNAGVVTFHRVDDRTKVMVQIDWNPTGVVEKAADAVGADEQRVRGDLGRFKQLIESRGQASGAWRGEIEEDEVRQGDTA